LSKANKQISSSAMTELKDYDFPGNVRELQHILERGILLSSSNVIEAEDLLLPNRVSKREPAFDVLCPLEEVEKAHIEQVLKKLDWNKTKAAEVLGISVRNLYRKIEQYKLIHP